MKENKMRKGEKGRKERRSRIGRFMKRDHGARRKLKEEEYAQQINRTGGRGRSKTQKDRNVKEQKKQGEDTMTGIHKGDKGDTYRRGDKENKKQKWSLC